MKVVKYIFCTFAAIWFPLNFIGGLLQIASLMELISRCGEIPLYGALIGAILILIDLWQTSKPQDEKGWWTTLGAIAFPIVIPAYWFGYGLSLLNFHHVEFVKTGDDSSNGDLKD